jgi:hypothetical protein
LRRVTVDTTPAWEVGAWDLGADLDKIAQQWDFVRAVLEDPELFDLRDAEISGWSCGEHAGHIAMVTHWIAAGIEENLRNPTRDQTGEWGEPTAWILEEGGFPRGVAESPPEVNTLGRPREDFTPILPTAVEAWRSIADKSASLPSCPARFPHFALGYMTSTEWVRFCALHTAHHLAVVRDLRGGAA